MKKFVSHLMGNLVKQSLAVCAICLIAMIWLVIGMALVSPLLVMGLVFIGGQSFVLVNFLSSLVLATGSFYLLGYFARITKAFQRTIHLFLTQLFTTTT